MDKMIRITGNTYQSDDYDMFKRLDGNRPVLAHRATKIKNSITKNGYIFNPIVVNEKMEIIDGQGRFEVLTSMNKPIDYVIAEGAGLEQCIALNASGTIWTLIDYINSYCEMGNESYIRMRQLIDEFPEISLPPKIMLITGRPAVPNEIIKKGTVVVTEKLAENARNDLAFASRFIQTLKRVKGTPNHYIYALVFACHCGANKDRLQDVMERADLAPAPNLRIALDLVSDIYNKNLKDGRKRLYLYALYEETMTNKYGWYGAKWANRT